MPFRPFEIQSVLCKDISFEGKGVVKTNQGVVFVSGLFPGEVADVTVLYRRNGQFFGKVKKLIKPSKDRVQPKCPICTACGGCCFQQLSYTAQLEYKSKKVKEQLRKVGKIDADVLPTLGMGNPYNYRNKIQVPFGYDKKGNLIHGFFKEGTHEIVPVSQCFIEDEAAHSILNDINGLLKKMRIPAYDEDSGKGLIRHVLVKVSKATGKVMIVLVTNGLEFPGRRNLVNAITSSHPEVETVVQNVNTRHTNVILGETEKVLFGRGYIEDELCGLRFKISPKAFYQTNPTMTEILYKTALDFAKLQENDVVLDAYSGVGTIGLIASRKAAKVVSVEIVEDAVEDGIHNAEINGIDNVEFVCGDATEFMVDLAKDKGSVDVVLMDPPRKGSTPEFLQAIKRLRPKRVVYVSCDCSSLARDLALLVKDYEIEEVQPVDMFPHTHHIETVVGLALKK